MFSHQKLKVYEYTVQFLTTTRTVLEQIPKGQSDIANQLKRASYSIALNIAEGAGKTGKADKKRFYAIARGSALECAAIFDVLSVFDFIDPHLQKKATQQLEEIVAMLSALVLKK